MDQNVKLNLTLVCVETVQVPESNLGSLDFGFQIPVLSQGQGVLSHQYVTAAVYVCFYLYSQSLKLYFRQHFKITQAGILANKGSLASLHCSCIRISCPVLVWFCSGVW